MQSQAEARITNRHVLSLVQRLILSDFILQPLPFNVIDSGRLVYYKYGKS
jgi:hypothetical protein